MKKVCFQCKKKKDRDEFYTIKTKGREPAPDSYCIPCRRRRNKRWAKKNWLRYKEIRNNWRKANPERVKLSSAKTRKKIDWNAYMRRWRAAKKAAREKEKLLSGKEEKN